MLPSTETAAGEVGAHLPARGGGGTESTSQPWPGCVAGRPTPAGLRAPTGAGPWFGTGDGYRHLAPGRFPWLDGQVGVGSLGARSPL